jgi:hypothetical protein
MIYPSGYKSNHVTLKVKPEYWFGSSHIDIFHNMSYANPILGDPKPWTADAERLRHRLARASVIA